MARRLISGAKAPDIGVKLPRPPHESPAHARYRDRARAVARQDHRAFRRPDRRRRHLRRRRRLSPHQQCPGTSFVVLEAQESFGGTWITHRYPGHPLRQRPLHLRLSLQAVDRRADRDGRRDPDLHGRGHRRERPRPRTSATAPDRPRRAGRATTSCWTIEATRTDTGETLRFTANFLWMCQGYYRHSEGYTPEWDGMADFKGRIVHPQTWPEDLDYAGKKVVVIGSGATAATLIPAIADDCAHVTMLQRSPTYFITGRNAERARRRAAPARSRRGVDPRDRAPQDPARPGGVHPAIVRRARDGEEELLGRRARLSRPRLRRRHAFHAELPAMAAAHRLRAGRRPVPGHPRRQGVGRHRRDRALHRDRHPAEVRQGCSRPTSSSPPPASISTCSATSTSRSTASRSTSPTRSPIAA